MALRLYSTGHQQPIDIHKVRAQLRIIGDHHDSEIISMVDQARDYIERRTRQILTRTQYRYASDCFMPEFEIPLSPVASVQSITYLDINGNEQLLDPLRYQVDLDSTPPRIKPSHGQNWPTIQPNYYAVKILFTAGFDDESDDPANHTPQSIQRAILLLVSHWFENREAVVVGSINSKLSLAVDELLAPFQRYD